MCERDTVDRLCERDAVGTVPVTLGRQLQIQFQRLASMQVFQHMRPSRGNLPILTSQLPPFAPTHHQ